MKDLWLQKREHLWSRLYTDVRLVLHSFFVADVHTTTRGDIERAIALAIWRVIDEAGIAALLGGNLVLDRKFHVRFCGEKLEIADNVLAVVPLDELAHAAIFRLLADMTIPSELHRASILEPFVVLLVDDVLDRLATQVPSLCKLN